MKPDDSLTVALLAQVEAGLRELHAGEFALPPVTLASALDRDLGLDSLGRMELLQRIEQNLGLALPSDTLQRAETVADLLQAVRRSRAQRPAVAGAGPAVSPDVAPALAVGGAAAPAGALGVGAPEAASTLVEVLAWHVRAHPQQTNVVWLHDGGELHISYQMLADAATARAAALQAAGVRPRQCVAIMLPTGDEYFYCYFGILMAGAIPVPIYPPARASQLQDHVLRHRGILANAGAVMLITVPEARGVARLLQAHVPGLRQVLTPAQLAAGGGIGEAPPLHGEDIAFIQYTSGSTGAPKGVALTHANLLANIRAMALAVHATPSDVFVSWLPLYHDMGLIGAWLAPLYVGFPLVVMSPLDFLARPLRWLQAITRWRGTLSAGPNFAYELCLRRIRDSELAGLDLRSWRLAFNGAEAVSPDTVRRFSQRFAACGLREQTMAPVYGLAEVSVGLLFPPLAHGGRVAPIDHVQREAFTREGRALPAAAADDTALRFVGCGAALGGHGVRIVDAQGVELGDRCEGRLEFKGPSATRGYFHAPAQTAQLFHDGWLDSGDRAYRADGELYITGRVKDIIIRSGRNLYPQEIEDAVAQVDGVRKGCVAAFGSPDPQRGSERLVVLAEVQPATAAAQALCRVAVARAVLATIGEPADDIKLVPAHTLLKTSSGKLRRSACRALYEAGDLARAPPSPARQWLHLALGALPSRLRHHSAGIARGLLACRAAAAFAVLAPAAWALTLLTRHPAAAWALCRRAARAWLRASGTRLTVQGLDGLPAGPCVLVSNHASYLDGIILMAVLPRPFTFVAKAELRHQFVAGRFLRKLGAVFVERFDAPRSVADAERLVAWVAQGHALAMFPEGTFVAQPGPLPFHLGAFLTAARAGVPVSPVAICGSREMLPDGAYWPRPGPLAVNFAAPLAPGACAGDVFACAVRLREAARELIASAQSLPLVSEPASA